MRRALAAAAAVIALTATVVAAEPTPPRATVLALLQRFDGAYPQVRVEPFLVASTGRTVVYRMVADYASIPADDFDAYEAAVRRFTRDRNEAAVWMLRETTAELPEAELVGVFEDSFDVRVWPRRAIALMALPASYREPEAFERLSSTALRYNFVVQQLPTN